MVDGGENIKEASWESVSSMLQVVSYFPGLRFHTSSHFTDCKHNSVPCESEHYRIQIHLYFIVL